jgi:hypothetical protein
MSKNRICRRVPASIFASANTIASMGLALGLLAGCGGGGGGGEPAPTITAPPHATATLALTGTAAPELAAQTVAVLSSLRSLGYQLAIDLESVSPANPTRQTPCASGGTWSYTYVDADSNGTHSAGDRILVAAPGCSIAPFGNGSATATVLAGNSAGLADVRIVIAGGTLPYLAGWNWVPSLTGTLRMTADADDLWLRSEGAIVFRVDALRSFRASNLGLRLRDDLTNNPPAPGILGSLDIGFDTPTGGAGSVAVDTIGLVAGQAANVAPTPGSIVLQGAGGSKVRIADAKPVNPGWFLLGIDADGNGAEEASSMVSFLNFFDAL